jgi:hypothetical protein
VSRFLDRFFILHPAPDPAWSLRRRAVYAVYRLAMVLCAGLCMGLALLVLSIGPYPNDILFGYLRSWLILALNAVPVALLVLLLYGALGRAWTAFLAGGGIALGFSLGNYYKLHFRDDPLYFEDMLILREAKAMASGDRYSLFFDLNIGAALFCLLLGTLLLRLLAPGRVRGWKRRLAPVLAALAVSAALSPVYLHAELYDSVENYDCLNRWSATQNYIAHGFAYPFFHSVGDFIETPPAGYHKSEAMELLSAYTDSDIPPDRQINVIAIMREAYADFSRYGVSGLDLSGYDLYHQLEAESLTGNLVTNIFAGGTVDTERCFLTGNYQLKNFRSNANSYLWYLRDQGYTVEGSHPYYQWFYNRQNINCYLGFERYRYYEGDYETRSAAIYPEDAVLLPEIYSDFQKNKATGKPYFSFSVNVQSHGPYATWDTGSPDCFADETYSLACRNAMNYYLATIWETDRELAKLMDWLRDDEEPVVLVTFGDHLPWMGDGNAFYEEMGIDVDPGTEEGFCRHYTTRYLIWANGAARALLGKDLQGQGPDISPCYLMNLVFQQLGWEGPAFMQAMTGMMNMFPVVSSASGLTMVDGRLTADIPEDRRALFQEFLYLQQYWRNEFLYE